MIHYVDDDGRVVVKLKGTDVPRQPKPNPEFVDFRKIEAEIVEKMKEDAKIPRAFYFINLRGFLTVFAVWEILTLYYFIGVGLIFVIAERDPFQHMLRHPYCYGFAASSLLHVPGWSLLVTLPKKNMFVLVADLVVHIVCMGIFFLAVVLCFIRLAYLSALFYSVLALLYAYISLLFNNFLKYLTDNKQDMFENIAILYRKLTIRKKY